MDDDRLYYARRAAEQRDAAARADSEDVRRRHIELANLLARTADTVPVHF